MMISEELINRSIFRAYDIRGIVDETMNEQDVYQIGKALGSLVRDNNETQMAVGRDGRLSGPRLQKTLMDGILSVGCDVIDVGMVPTPILYYATHLLKQHSGVMLTGSHNPANYNGLKMVIKGKTLAEQGIVGLYQRIAEQRFSKGKGEYFKLDMQQNYIAEVTKSISLQRPLRIVVDAGNGVTGKMAPALFRQMGCEVFELFCEIDGNFPNHHPDPSMPENLTDLIGAVRERKADVGFAFDGDGDRLGVVTNEGEIIYPDRLLMLYAKALLKSIPNANIIYDVKCTYHLDDLIKSLGGTPTIWRTGHSLIKAKLAESKAQLAGEMSGHFFFNDRWYGFDDALYAGARLLEILAQEQESCHEVFQAIPNSVNTPELKVKVTESEKFSLMQKLIDHADFQEARDILTIDGLRVNFNDGWGLVRPSNTSPYLILRFEAIDEGILKKIQSMFRAWMLSVKADLKLPF